MDGQQLLAQQHGQAVRRKMMGARMRALRLQFEVSLEECAQALGLTSNGLAERELGRRPLLVGEFWRFCAYLGVQPSMFFEVGRGPRGRLPGARRLRLQRKILGALLAEGRDNRGWSRGEAAGRTRMSQERLRLSELGQEELALSEAEALAEIYGVGRECLTIAPGADITEPEVEARNEAAPGVAALPQDIGEFLARPDAERCLRASMALGQLDERALTALEDALYFLKGSA